MISKYIYASLLTLVTAFLVAALELSIIYDLPLKWANPSDEKCFVIEGSRSANKWAICGKIH